MHLIVDGYGGDVKVMEDPDALLRFLDEYPDAIGMTKITPPQVYTYTGRKPKDNGLSGFVLIAESHISVHTFPSRKYINIDVFSCKEFDADKALNELRATFSLETVRSWVLDRGLEYADLETAAREVEMERSQLMSRL
ncbi:MAG: S-adenosylmethionine decarboxylase [Chloroflexi bacterium]|nr:S-adenosylmethionine decarboxylase [Chloroflexota bacterium]